MPIVIFELYIVKKISPTCDMTGIHFGIILRPESGIILLLKLGYLLEGALELAVETLNGGDVHALGG